MEETAFFLAKIDLHIISQRIQNSLDEIKRKSPDRKEYIEPMNESIQQIAKVTIFLEQIKAQLETSRQRNIDLEFINLKLMKEIQELNNQIKYNNLEI